MQLSITVARHGLIEEVVTERHNGRVNAVVVKDSERARRRADAADESFAGGVTWGPLHGVPVTVKENNDVEGLPSTLGFEVLMTHHAAAHSCVVQRLVDAGEPPRLVNDSAAIVSSNKGLMLV
ncbi:Indoleacetamide hydrolase [Diplonema papillatum]|nr:Indoleacetamide hydrolase [Diplonema papillatum]